MPRAVTADLETADPERGLWQRKCRGDQQAREQLIFRHLGLARHLANKCSGLGGLGEPLEDLIQVATIGLINAVDRFDPNRGLKFATFATPTIWGELKHYLRDKGGSVKLPRQLSELRQNIARAENDLTQRFQHPPTVSEIAEYLDVPPNEVSDAILASESLRLQSLEQVIENDDCLGGPDPGIQRIEGTALIGQILDAIAQLNEKDKKLIQLYYFENKNQAEIARIMDINQVQVARLLKRTIKKIREIILSSAHQL